MIGASDHILWTAVQTDIDSADVFAADTEHQHDHAADKEHGGHQGAVSHQDRCRMEQFIDNHVKPQCKSDDGADDTGKCGNPERLDGKRGKSIRKQRDQFSESLPDASDKQIIKLIG